MARSKKVTYAAELTKAMKMLAEDPRTLFLGQAVAVPGTAMFGTLRDVPMDKRIELPVAEDMQLGMCIGLALAGFTPVCIFPRWNFLLLAMNQLVNHLDKMDARVIIRTAVGSERPLYPGPQHCGDHTAALKLMAKDINVRRIDDPFEIVPYYALALRSEYSSLLVEWGDMLNS